MAHQVGNCPRTEKTPLGITAFWPCNCTEAPMLWEHWLTSFTWAIIAKHRFYLTRINFAKTLPAAQFSDLPADVLRIRTYGGGADIDLKSVFMPGRKGQQKLDNRLPRLPQNDTISKGAGRFRESTKQKLRDINYCQGNNGTANRLRCFIRCSVIWQRSAT